jgi:uncharacterized membrane protein YqiK
MSTAWQMLSAALPLLAVLVFFILPLYLLLWFKKFRIRKNRHSGVGRNPAGA